MIVNEGVFLSRIENLLLDVQSNTGYPIFLLPDTQVYKDHQCLSNMFVNIPYKNKIIQFVANKLDVNENIKTFILSNPIQIPNEEIISENELTDIKNIIYKLTDLKPIEFKILSKKNEMLQGKPLKASSKKKYQTQELVPQDMFDF